MRAVQFAVAIWVWFAVAACGDSFAPQYWVNAARVIAVVADPPEVAAAASTTLTAVLADPSGSTTPNYRWWRCTKIPATGVSEDIDPDCLRDDTNVDYLVPLGSGSSITLTMPEVDPSTLGNPDYTFGVYVSIRVDAQIGSSFQKTIYRLRLRTPTSLAAANQNPAFNGLYLAPATGDAGVDELIPLTNDEPLATMPLDGKLDLRARFADGSSEPFVIIDGEGAAPKAANEALRVQWNLTWGDLSDGTSGDDTSTQLSFKDKTQRPPSVPPEGVVVQVWAVGRDERGGAGIISAKLRVLP